MQPQEILILILTIVSVSFVFDQVLDYINLRAIRTDLPEEVASFYDREKYAKAQQYHRELGKFSFFTSSFSFAVSLTMLLLGGFG